MKTSKNVSMGMGSRNKFIIMSIKIEPNQTIEEMLCTGCTGYEPNHQLNGSHTIVSTEGYLSDDEVIIQNPRLKRGADAPHGSNCAAFAAIGGKKISARQKWKKKKEAGRREKAREVSLRRQTPRVLLEEPQVVEEVKDEIEVLADRKPTKLKKILHEMVMEANKKNKHLKKMRKLARRVTTEGDNPYGLSSDEEKEPLPIDGGFYSKIKGIFGQRTALVASNDEISNREHIDEFDEDSELTDVTPQITPNSYFERLLSWERGQNPNWRGTAFELEKDSFHAWEKSQVRWSLPTSFLRALNPVLDLLGKENKLVSTIADVISFLYLIRKSDSAIGYMMVVRWLVCTSMSNFTSIEQSAAIAAIGSLSGLVALFRTAYAAFKTSTGVVTEGLVSDSLDKFASFIKSIHNCSVMSAIKAIAMSIAALKLFDMSIAKQVFSWCGKPLESNPVDLVSNIISSIGSVVRAGELMMEGVPICDALFGDDPLQIALNTGRKLVSYRNMLYYGLPVEGRMNESDFVRDANEVLPILRSAMKKVNPFTPIFKQCSEIVTTLHPVVEGVKARILGSKRMAPFGVIVTSKPGVGKSSVLPWVCRILADVMNRQYSEHQNFHRIKSSDFWECYDTFVHNVVHYSELGDQTAALAKQMGDDIIKELTSVIDNVPLPLNVAFEDKGKVFFNAEMVIADTNNPSLNLKHFVSNPAAFLRRFLFITVEVKDEFRVEGGCGIDVNKCDDDLRMMDRFLFTIHWEKQIDNTKSEKIVLANLVDCDVAYDIISLMMRRHFTHQRRIVGRAEDDVKQHYGSIPENNVFDIDADIYAEVEAEGDYVDYYIHKVEQGYNGISNWIQPKLQYCRYLFEYTKYIGFCTNDLVQSQTSSLLYSFIPDIWISRIHRWTAVLVQLLIVAFTIFTATQSVALALIFFFIMSLALQNLFVEPVGLEVARRAALRERRDLALRRFNVALGRDKVNVLFYTAAALGSFVMTYAVVRMFWKAISSVFTEAETEFKFESPVNKQINEVENLIGSQRAIKRTQGSIPEAWITTTLKTPIVHTGDALSLDKAVSQNCRSVHIEWDNGNSKSCVLGVYADYVLINRHCLPVEGDFTVKVDVSGTGDFSAHRITLTNISQVIPVTTDAVLLRLSSMQFKDITKHFSDIDFKAASGYICGSLIAVKTISKVEARNKYHGTVIASPALEYDWPGHKRGACGSPIVIDVSRRACLVGIHFAGDELGVKSFGIRVSKTVLDEAIATTSVRRGLMNIVSLSPETESHSEPHARSPFRFENLNVIEYLGSDGKPANMNNKSSITKSRFGSEVSSLLSQSGLNKTQVFAAPLLRPTKTGSGVWINPFTINLHKMNTTKKSISAVALSRCVRRFVAHIVSQVGEDLSPLTMEQAINGSNDDAYLRRINVRTGAGYAFKGKKYQHLPISVDEPGNLLREPNGELKKLLMSKMSHYFNGQSTGAIFGAKLKDEPRAIEKVLKGKTRMFFPSQVDLLIISRMVLAPFFTMMVANRDVMKCAVGIDMHTEGDSFRKKLVEFSVNIFEGDYGGFDTSMPYEIGLAASTVIHEVCRIKGYSEEALKLLEGVLTDNLFPVVEVNGDIMNIPGLMTSGSYGTAEFNCIRNVLLMMFFFETHEVLTLDDFFSELVVTTYGDDVVGAVSDKIAPYFNCLSYSSFCREHYGMEFTTSSKGEVELPFVDVESMSFLKRNFIYNKDIQKWVAVLDVNTLFKMVEWVSLPDDVTESDHAISIFTSLLYEIALRFSRDEFIHFRYKLADICNRVFGLEDVALPTWRRIVCRINPEAIVLREEEERNPEVGSDKCNESDYDPGLKISCESLVGDFMSSPHFLYNKIQRQNNNSELIAKLEKRKIDLELEHKELLDQMDGLHPLEKLMGTSMSADSPYRTRRDLYRSVWAEIDSINLTLAMYRRMRRNIMHGLSTITESDDMSAGTIDVGAETKVENIIDVTGGLSDMSMVGTDRLKVSSDDFDVKAFLARPIQVASVVLGQGASFDLKYDIWDIFTSNPSIRAKLRNFAFMKCDLGVKIAVSGTPFHAGRLLVSYQPFPDVNETLGGFGITHRTARLKYLSQAPGARTIDVRSNKPLDIVCPYVSPKPIGRLFNTATGVISAASPFEDFAELGSLYVSSINNITACSTNPSDVYMQIYLYAKNISLHGSTGTQMSITTESDECNVGPLERMSSGAVKISNLLSSIPMIKPYSTISSIAFGAMRDVAAMFGWSYPTLVSVPTRIRPDPFQNGAQVVGVDTGKRVTIDPKQELAMEIGAFANDGDDLVISSIAKRESLFDTFPWEPTDDPLLSSLWRTVVSPRAQKCEVIEGAYYANPTPLAFAATPFGYWRGDLIFRIEVVCSAFHRGKIMFVFEPNITQFNLIGAATSLNKQYVRIVDIQETQDFEFCVEWNMSRSWAANLTNEEVRTSVGEHYVFDANMPNTCNGILYVVPFTRLQSPDDNGVEINVYVRSDKVIFNRMTNALMPTSHGYVTESEITPVETTCMSISKEVLPMEGIAGDCFGEQPVSFRSLLKRFMNSYYYNVEGDSTYWHKFTVPTFPAPNSEATLYSYLKWAYLCQRGALRRRIRVVTKNEVSSPLDARVLVSNENDVSVSVSTVTYTSTVFPSLKVDGTVQFLSSVNGGYEFEIPFYTNNLFAWACNSDPFLSIYNMNPSALRTYTINYESSTLAQLNLYEMFAAGEDFNFARWLGAYPYQL